MVLLQPVAEDLAVMGNNLMSGRRRHEVIETAVRSVTEALSQGPLRDALAGLPRGEPHKIGRPAGDPASWPEFLPAGARRAA